MSHIFDGLRRSEADGPEIDPAALSGATELLQLAERKATLKWETTVLTDGPFVSKGTDHETSFGLLGALPVTTTPKPPAPFEFSPAFLHADPFSQFQSLQVTLAPQSRLICLTDSGSPAAEAFRLLSVRLRHLRRQRPLKKVLITSTIPQEGKSMVAANLACTLALRTQQKILLLEGDLRRPSLSQRFGLGRNPGLCECLLQSERSVIKSIYHLGNPNLWILPAGSAPSNALELLQSSRLSALMEQLVTWFDWVIIDSPPVLPLADTSVWMRIADGILLVTRQGTTEKRKLQRGLEALEPQKMIGAIVNGSENAADSDYYYGPATIGHREES
jgi:capsular exopolysaccharide synthesis family protein